MNKEIITPYQDLFDDEYFIHLTMKCDEKNPMIYSEWARWCLNSDDKYYIDMQDGYFYTHTRTEEEIAIEKQKNSLLEFLNNEKKTYKRDFAWPIYERYIYSMILNPDLNNKPMHFPDWIEYKRKLGDQ